MTKKKTTKKVAAKAAAPGLDALADTAKEIVAEQADGDGFALIVHCGLADDNAGALKLVTGILNASSGRPDRSGERSGPNGGNPSPKITKHVYRFPEGKKHLIGFKGLRKKRRQSLIFQGWT